MFFRNFPKELETRFLENYNKDAAPISRKSIFIGSEIYILFHLWDIAIDPLNAHRVLLYRLIIVGIFLAIGMTPEPYFSKHLQVLMMFAITLAGVGVSLIIAELDDGLSLGVGGLVLVLMFNFGFFRLLCIPSLICGILICTSYNIVALVNGLSERLIFANNAFLISALVSGVYVNYLVERLFRSRFLILIDLGKEKARSDELLRNVLPDSVATKMLNGQIVTPETHNTSTVLFSDLVGFTNLANTLSPEELVTVLNEIFSILDHLTEKHGVEKVKTVGDAYMVIAAQGLSRAHTAEAIAEFAIEMMIRVEEYSQARNLPIQLRAGISTGHVISGVLGLRRLSFDLWGETVNLASRLESTSLPGRILICDATYQKLKHIYEFEPCPRVALKGIGNMELNYLLLRKPAPPNGGSR